MTHFQEMLKKGKRQFGSERQLARKIGLEPSQLSTYKTRGSAGPIVIINLARVIGADPLDSIIRVENEKRRKQTGSATVAVLVVLAALAYPVWSTTLYIMVNRIFRPAPRLTA